MRIRVKNGGAVYRVPEDMFPTVANAMVAGGTAEIVEDPDEKKSAGPKVETASVVSASVRTAMRSRARARQGR
jgi:hypothetical protein